MDEPDESLEQIEERVVAEVAAERQAESNARYAERLRSSFDSYRNAGFSRKQAWALLRDEHISLLEVMGAKAMDEMGD